jgi:tRNA(Ile)-lysidine synthase
MMSGPAADLPSVFSAAMEPLGPFEPNPSLAVAVSGGADSMALALLTRDWVRARGGSLVAFVVDHALRPTSGDEARLTLDRLRHHDIPARLLTIAGLMPGSALAERARISRYDILTSACAEANILHLLLGHHLGDQAETLAMRVLRGSHASGLAGMAALRETTWLRLLRPLLGIEPVALRTFLSAAGAEWVEDPSNRNLQTLRARLRMGFADTRLGDTGLRQAAAAAGDPRRREEAAIAAELAKRASIRPEGYAVLSPGRMSPGALGALIQTISGSAYPPAVADVAAAGVLRAQTLAGARILAAKTPGEGWLLIREEAAIAPPLAVSEGALWDGRFRIANAGAAAIGTTIGKLGDDAARFRRASPLPSALLRTLPAIRIGEKLASVPHLGYRSSENDQGMTVLFSPRKSATGPRFFPAA